jgi:hypothetical protein
MINFNNNMNSIHCMEILLLSPCKWLRNARKLTSHFHKSDRSDRSDWSDSTEWGNYFHSIPYCRFE